MLCGTKRQIKKPLMSGMGSSLPHSDNLADDLSSVPSLWWDPTHTDMLTVSHLNSLSQDPSVKSLPNGIPAIEAGEMYRNFLGLRHFRGNSIL